MVTARSPHGETRRTEILQIARTVLVDDGLDQFVMRNIAGRMGMTLGNLQYYYSTRDDLLEAVIRAEFEQDVAIIRTTIERCAEPGCALGEVARRLVEHWCDGGSVFAALTMLAHHNDRFRDLNQEIYQTFYDELAVLISVADPRASRSEIDARVRLVASLLDGVAIQNHARADPDPDVCADLLERAGALVLQIATGEIGGRPAHASG